MNKQCTIMAIIDCCFPTQIKIITFGWLIYYRTNSYGIIHNGIISEPLWDVFLPDLDSSNMNNNDCPLCNLILDPSQKITLQNELCLFLQKPQKVLVGSGIIVPKAHKVSPFELSSEEWNATFDLLIETKKYIDNKHSPNGYNLGWNIEKIGGQEIFHSHFHVIPRFEEEPFAGKGIRYWLKQEENSRNQKPVERKQKI